MKKRLQKKRHVGKFREYGIEVIAKCDFSSYPENYIDAEFSSFLQFIDSNNWIMGGGFGNCFISDDHYNRSKPKRKYKNLTTEDANRVRKFYESKPWCIEVFHCMAKDAWYNPF